MKFNYLKIKDVCDFVGGSQPPKSQFIYVSKPGYVRLIQTRDYKTDAFPTYIPISSTKKFCDEFDIMIGRYGPPIFQICRGLKGAYNVALLKVIPKEGVSRDFLYYFLKQDSVFQYVDKLSARTGGQTGVDLVSLKEYPVRIPEEIECQEKLVTILSVIDKKIALNNRINTELEAMAKTLYDYWFVQFDFPDANGKPYKTSGGKMEYNATLKREIPAGWKSGTLDDLGQIVGGSTPTTSRPENFTTNGTPWITPNDLSDNQSNKFISRGAQDVSVEGIKSASLKTYPAGTVLLSSRAPIGYMAIARNELTTNQGFKSFIPSKNYSTEYVYYAVKNSLPVIMQNASGSTFKEVSGSVLKSIDVMLPAFSVADDFTKTVAGIFSRQDKLEQENQQLTALRDWLLPLLMNGQVTVK
ncbi:restriction endonuclease subunit S [Escherichia coli]|uniref:Restriction endonuclease subunit S n=1 Tax=Escherichia coli TaxID=562 RepID=A0A8S7EJ76_ECOLX|nr:restriction endonuclease subunit S [Escherichia coli]EFB3615983.1 restriction endonuclease subunit S [Escherichia coli]EFB3635755.1 restriction endonuclease subunit S [Escherichia coli]EFB5254057.1 restriction endonuclease subunit S [Escherichia coli]EFH7451871.1 restriction endonuclease subunit S [Escherichia coli]MBA8428173.1 restriction endonuclease subunit S [Escherichia coli]